MFVDCDMFRRAMEARTHFDISFGDGTDGAKKVLEVSLGHIPMQVLDGQLASGGDLVDLGLILWKEHGSTRGAVTRSATRGGVVLVAIMLP